MNFRSQLTKDDVKVYAAVLGKPSGDLYPYASKWYETVSAKLASRYSALYLMNLLEFCSCLRLHWPTVWYFETYMDFLCLANLYYMFCLSLVICDFVDWNSLDLCL